MLGRYRGYRPGRAEVTPVYKPYGYVPGQSEGFLPKGDTPDFKGKPPKIPRAFNNTHKKSLDQKKNIKFHAEFLSLEISRKENKVCRLNFNRRTRWPGFVGAIRNLQIVVVPN